MGRNHPRALADSTDVRVVAIAEPAEATRRTVRADAALYPSLDDMLNAGDIDAVLVCVPSDQHLATVKRLVTAHGGAVGVRRGAMGGALFWCELLGGTVRGEEGVRPSGYPSGAPTASA